jgi:hypothetical protein
LDTEEHDQADANLRAAYFGLLSLSSGRAEKGLASIHLETDTPFALLVLDKLILLYMLTHRRAEAYALANKSILLWNRLRFPGSLADIQPFMGHRLPYFIAAASFSKYRNEGWEKMAGKDRLHWNDYMSPSRIEQELRSNPGSNHAVVAEWVDMGTFHVLLTNTFPLMQIFSIK